MNLRSPTLSIRWLLLMLTCVVIVLIGVRLISSILNPVLLALLMTLLVTPVQNWLLRHKVPGWLAIVLIVIGGALLFGFLWVLMRTSIQQLITQMDYYSTRLDSQVENLEAFLQRFGISDMELSTLLHNDAISALLRKFTGTVGSVIANVALILIVILFLLGEGSSLVNRLLAGTRGEDPRIARLATFGDVVIRQFSLRAVVNVITGTVFGLFLYLIGVDFALLWGVLTFFLSYIPYLGIVIAGIPAVLLALAEFGIEKALLVIVGLVIINALAENFVAPMLMGRGLNISPTVIFLSFIFWVWLLGGAGAFLAIPLTIFIALISQTYPETRWLARMTFVRPLASLSSEESRAVAKPVDIT
jgi:AI-2 transport protein TqsA